MANLTVGAGQQYSTIAAAVAASHDGDVLLVQAGTYVNDFASINTKITIQGVGGMAHIVATAQPGNAKGILVTNTDVTLDHIELSGATVPDGNGAGVRYQGGHLTMTDCYVHDNQDGILANPVADGAITIRDSEFAHNGAGDGYTHNIYVGHIASLTIENSYIHDAVVGHEIKSRADSTTITGNRIIDGANGTASYSIDLPNAGKALISGNVIQQGPASQNPAIIHFGGEGYDYPGSSLEIASNTVLNELSSPSTRLLLNQTGVTASIHDVQVWGLTGGQIASGPATVGTVTTLGTKPGIDTSSPWQAADPGHQVTGTAAADVLLGGAGADTIIGGGGSDMLTGGAGADHFVYLARTDRLDHILDFDAVQGDVLDLSAVFGARAHPHDLASLEAQGFVRLDDRASGVRVMVDLNGGGNQYVGLTWLDGEHRSTLGDHFLVA